MTAQEPPMPLGESRQRGHPLDRGWGLGVLTIVIVTVGAYLPVFRCGFIWDDDHFLTQNPLIRASDGLRAFWFSSRATDYWPVTSTSLWFEWRLWGMKAAGYHATNVALHIAACLLIWKVLRDLRIGGAFLAALLFAVHPINVESVAWITQRKNLLAMVFFLLTLLFFLRREKSGGAPWYWLSLSAFGLGMLSKGSVATAPLVLLGMVAWRRRPAGRDYAALAPFFALAVGLTGVNVWFQRHGTGDVIRSAGALERWLEAAAIPWFYLAKAAFPWDLIFCYPQWRVLPGDFADWLPLTAVFGAAAALWGWRGAIGRGMRFSAAYFVVMLIPVMGFTDVYFMKYSLVADHYAHLALIGVTAVGGFAWSRWRPGPARTAAAAGLVLLFAALTWRQCGIYRDRPTLFRATIARNPGCWMAQNNLGLYLIDHGRYGEALGYCQSAVRLQPDFAEAHNNLGIALAGTRDLPASVVQFREALRLKPNYPQARNNLGNAFRLEGKLPEAAREYVAALRLNPDYAEARNNLGVVLMDARRPKEAVAQLREAIRLMPGYVDAYDNLALALRQAGRPEEATAVENEARRLRGEAAGTR